MYRAVDLLEGSLPQAADEIAVEQDALRVLFPGATVGDTVTLPSQRGEQYRVVGILEPYQIQWRALNGSKTFVNYPPPTILTIPGNQPAQYIHLFLADSSLTERFGGFFEHSDTINNPTLANGHNTVDVVVAVLFILFTSIMIFGLTSISRFTLKEINRHILLLRCVGMTRKQAKKLFMSIGLVLWGVTSVIALVSSLLFSVLFLLLPSAYAVAFFSALSSAPQRLCC